MTRVTLPMLALHVRHFSSRNREIWTSPCQPRSMVKGPQLYSTYCSCLKGACFISFYICIWGGKTSFLILGNLINEMADGNHWRLVCGIDMIRLSFLTSNQSRVGCNVAPEYSWKEMERVYCFLFDFFPCLSFSPINNLFIRTLIRKSAFVKLLIIQWRTSRTQVGAVCYKIGNCLSSEKRKWGRRRPGNQRVIKDSDLSCTSQIIFVLREDVRGIRSHSWLALSVNNPNLCC